MIHAEAVALLERALDRIESAVTAAKAIVRRDPNQALMILTAGFIEAQGQFLTIARAASEGQRFLLPGGDA